MQIQFLCCFWICTFITKPFAMRLAPFLIPLFFLWASCKDATPPYIKNHSYKVFTYDKVGGRCMGGTGFFYKKGNNVYFISNYHVIKGWDPYTKKMEINVKLIAIGIPYKEEEDVWFYRQFVTGKIDSFDYTSKIDLHAELIKEISPHGDYNFINAYIDENYINKTPDKVYVYGYPNSKGVFCEQKAEGLLQSGEIKYSFDDFEKNMLKLNPKEGAQIKDLANKLKKSVAFITTSVEAGMSGSLVWGKFGKLYKIIGVVFASDDGFSTDSLIINGQAFTEFLNGLP